MNDTLKQIRESLGHVTMKWAPSSWLDTGLPDLNRVLGHRDRGIPYGKMIEISGWESQGKSALMLAIAALAQQDGAFVIYGDVENSFDPGWAKQRGFAKCPKCDGTGVAKTAAPCPACGGSESPTCGLDGAKLLLIQPYVGQFQYKDPKTGKTHKEKTPRLSTAQELLAEIESGMSLSAHTKRVVILDSVAALLTEGESLAGIENANMRSDMDLPKLMSRLLRRWVGLGQVHNALIILVNQLREGPVKFGDPAKTPGGNAPKFYSHIRVRVRRVKGGRLVDGGKQIGIMGVMKALKNKSGGEEGAEIGYRILFKGAVEFISAKEAKKAEAEAYEQ